MNTPPVTVVASPAALPWRLFAMVYDLLPLLGIFFGTAAVTLLVRLGEPVEPNTFGAWLELLLMLIAGFGYFGLSWRRGGQTLGMRAWRLRLLNPDSTVPSWRQLVLRYVVAGVSLGAGGLGYLWSLIDAEHRTWHDMASGTMLLRLPEPEKKKK